MILLIRPISSVAVSLGGASACVVQGALLLPVALRKIFILKQYCAGIMRQFMTTSEVADYLRLKPRKVYELVRGGDIPCARVTGKLLFPRQAIDLWVLRHMQGDHVGAVPAPPVYAGSHDPLLEWALRQCGADLGVLCNGSGDGVRRLCENKARLVGLHVLDPDSGEYNNPTELGLGGMPDLVTIEWARRVQGLVVAPGNPLSINAVNALRSPGIRVAYRQHGAGAATLFNHLLRQAGIDPAALTMVERPSLNEDDLALEVRNGAADCGLAVEASARRHGLDFVALATERFDLAMRRRDYFEPSIQRLLAFTRDTAFAKCAAAYRGYDIAGCGTVMYNA